MKRVVWVLVLLLCLGAPRQAAASVSVSAQSAVLYLPQSGTLLYQKQAHEPRPMASTTKLMTALLLAEALPADQTVTVPAAALPAEGSSMGLRAGDTLTVRDLLAGMLLASGNDAANAAACIVAGSQAAFAEQMNARALQLGMNNTLFVTPSGLDKGEHHSTAYDMALLGAAVMQHPLLREICATKNTTAAVSGRTVWLQNHNRLLSLYPHAVGLKTGFTKKAGRCLVSAAEKDGVLLIAVTLSAPDDWNDHIALYNDGFARAARQPLPPPLLPAVPLIGGEQDTVALQAQPLPDAVVLQGETLQWEYHLPARLFAPVTAGQRVGAVHIRAGERTVAVLDVTVSQSVAARAPHGFFQKVAHTWCLLLQDIFVL